MSSDAGEPEQKKQIIIKRDQELYIFKVVFKEGHKWEFFYQNNRIYASVNDRNYAEKAIKGEIAFRSGDRIIVDIKIIQVFNDAANIFVNDEYHIMEVKKHIPGLIFSQKLLKFIEKDDNKN